MSGQLILDVTHTVAFGFTTGIQRVTRRLVAELARQHGAAVVPVVAIGGAFHRLDEAGRQRLMTPARDGPGPGRAAGWKRVVGRLLMRLAPALYDRRQERLASARIDAVVRAFAERSPLAAGPGDRVVFMDAFWGGTSAGAAGARARGQGAALVVVVYDLIPFTHPAVMPAAIVATFVPRMRRALAEADGAVAISRDCARQVKAFMRGASPPVASFYLGDDPLDRNGANRAPATTRRPRAYLLVGTIEPRKGHALVLDAFERRWRDGDDVTVTFVGKMGWAAPDLVERCRSHPQLGRRFHLVEDADDAMLAALLRDADATIVASSVEGFGLPLVESLAADVPVIASDIPVFREIGGDAVQFFAPGDAAALRTAMTVFERDADRYRAAARAFRWIDWAGSARQFDAALDEVLDRHDSRQLAIDGTASRSTGIGAEREIDGE